MMKPPSSGPSTEETLLNRKLSVLAEGTSSIGTSRGMIALRAGEDMANPVDCTATAAMITHTLFSVNALTRSTSVADQLIRDAVSSSLRRSMASAMAPPHSPKITSGISATGPSMPTQNEERVSANTSALTAIAVSWNPTKATA
jgi:hypothetical protein